MTDRSRNRETACMAFHCGAPTRDGSPCQRHVRDLATRCPQHRNLGGTALHPPRHAMRVITLDDPALTAAPAAWGPRDRVTPGAAEASQDPEVGSQGTGDDGEGRAGVGGEREGGAERGRAQEPEPDEAESRLDLERLARATRYEPKPKPAEKPARSQEPEPDEQPEPDGQTAEVAKPQPTEQRPQLRKERALDPDWIGGRPLFRDQAPSRPRPKIEFEPSDAAGPPKPARIPPMRSVVLNPPEPDPPTLIDRIPPIAHDDLVVPDFLRPDFGAPAAVPEANGTRPPLPQRKRRPRPAPKADPDPPTLIDPHPPIPAADPARPAPIPSVVSEDHASLVPTPTPIPIPIPSAATENPAARSPARAPAPDRDPADDIAVPPFLVPGFIEPPPKPPLRTVLSTVLGPDLWQRCYVEWSPAHCTALARIARAVDGLAPSATAAVRSTAGAGMRWLGVAREREMLADLVADAISHPVGATAPNQARTVRLYGAAICMALNVPLRRCACHRDLERDVSSELIRLGLEELAGEVP